MVSGKRLAIVLAVEVIVVAAFWATLYLYPYYGPWFNEQDSGPKAGRAIYIQSYSAARDGAGFNLTLNILNCGDGKVVLDKIFMEEYREPPNGTYIPPHNWTTIDVCTGLEINQNETVKINICLPEETISKTGTNSQVKVTTVDGTFTQTQIDLLDGA